jgi:uncharacterized membrane protein
MEDSIVNVFSTLVGWLKSHYCWSNISFWNFGLACFIISMFCRIVFKNSDSSEKEVLKNVE